MMEQQNNDTPTENLGQSTEPTTTETTEILKETGNANGPANFNGDTSYCLVVGNLLESLECNICTDILSPPVRMCRNGHSICSGCLSRVDICGFCESGFSKARNYTMENILSTCSVPCEFQKNGCPEVVLLANYAKHINDCPMNPNPIPDVPPIRTRRVPMTSNNSNSSSVTSSPATPHRRLTHFYNEDDDYDDYLDIEDDPYLMAIPYTVHRRRRPTLQETTYSPPNPRPIQLERALQPGHTPNRSVDRNSSIRTEGTVSASLPFLPAEDGSMNMTFASPSFRAFHHSTPCDNNNSRPSAQRQMRRQFPLFPHEPSSSSSAASSNLNTTPVVTQSIGYFYPSNTPRTTHPTSTTVNPFSTIVTTNAGSFYSNNINTGNTSHLRRTHYPDVPYRPMSHTVGPSTYTNRPSYPVISSTVTTGAGTNIGYPPIGLRRSSSSSSSFNNNNSSSIIPNVIIPVRQPFPTIEYQQVPPTPFRFICSTPNPINPVQSSTPTRTGPTGCQRFCPPPSFRLISEESNSNQRQHQSQPRLSSTYSFRTPLLDNTNTINMPQSYNRNRQTMEPTNNQTVEPLSQEQQQQQQVPTSSDYSTQSVGCAPLPNDINNWSDHFRRLYALALVASESNTRNEDDFDMTEAVGTSSSGSSSSSDPSSTSTSSSSSVLSLSQTRAVITENRQNVTVNESTTSTEQSTNQQQNNNNTLNDSMTTSSRSTTNVPQQQQNLLQSRYHSLFLRINSDNNNNSSSINENHDSSSEQSASFNADNNNTVNDYDADVEDYCMDVVGDPSTIRSRYCQHCNCKLDGLSALSNFCKFCFRPL